MKTLKEELEDWTDYDVAEHKLALCLGLMDEDVSFQTDAKHVFWSSNPIGDTLGSALEMFVNVGFLEYDDEDQRFRWKQDFRGTWIPKP